MGLHHTAIHNTLKNNENTDSLKFRHSLAQGITDTLSSGVSCPACSRPSIEPLNKRNLRMTFLGVYSCHRKEAEPQRKYVMCSTHGKKLTLFIGIMNVKQGCI
jgi:hypothetical protein